MGLKHFKKKIKVSHIGIYNKGRILTFGVEMKQKSIPNLYPQITISDTKIQN